MRKHQELVQQQHDQTTSALRQTRDHLRRLMNSVISEMRQLERKMIWNHQQTTGQMNTHQQFNQHILSQLQGQVDQLQRTIAATKSQLDAFLRQLSEKLDAVQWMSCLSQAGADEIARQWATVESKIRADRVAAAAGLPKWHPAQPAE